MAGFSDGSRRDSRPKPPQKKAQKAMTIFIVVGEPSGDLYGEQLLKQYPTLKLMGVGGPKMRALKGFHCLLPMEKFHVMGFVDVFLALPKMVFYLFWLKKQILKAAPQTVLFIDYPDFNLRLAKSLKKSGFKGTLVHYICPSIWAWRKKRIFLMEKALDHLFCILPFEKGYFATSPLAVHYAGHPLIQKIEEHRHTPFPEKKWIALFPGSRKKEILLNFPIQLKVAKKLLEEDPSLSFAVSLAHEKFRPLLRAMMKEFQLPLVEEGCRYDLMRSCHAAIAKSGTVTLELALHKVPTVVTYGIAPFDLFIARTILKIKLPFYALPNIIHGKELFPELFGPNLTFLALYGAAKRVIYDEAVRKECQEKCAALYNLLKHKEADGSLQNLFSTSS
jgi:lipid-A-disaccharide synthase